MIQTSLMPTPPAPAPSRRSSKGIAPGDIVEVDKKGRRFHAIVVELDQVESGRFHLSVRPLDSRISYRQATVREVVGVWRRAGRAA
jgi:bifunctional DNA-binding transcriptional regulator/antitoxin component of YhaV-PrlF toxin-antitoxin module